MSGDMKKLSVMERVIEDGEEFKNEIERGGIPKQNTEIFEEALK
jgi:hypothetical protein